MNSRIGSMSYFTPELYLRLSSPDRAIATQAEEDWERANVDYHHELESITSQMPSHMQTYAESTCFQDSVLLEFRETVAERDRAPFSTEFVLKNEVGLVTHLTYSCPAPSRHIAAISEWPTPSQSLCWLYDEFATSDQSPGCYLHKIMLSDGRQVVISFVDVSMRR